MILVFFQFHRSKAVRKIIPIYPGIEYHLVVEEDK